MSIKSLILAILVCVLWHETVAQERQEYSGTEAIKELHDGWLVVRLPGFEKKLSVIDSLLSQDGVSEKHLRDLEREKRVTLENRDFIQKWYPVIFDNAYTFSRVAFIYKRETGGFQDGIISARASDGKPIDALHLQKYFFATLDGIQNYPFVFTSSDHRKLAYPFPASIGLHFGFSDVFGPGPPQWISDLGEESKPVFRVYKHITRVNRKLNAFYKKHALRP